jgi:UDP-glucose 4-epimerase
MSDATVIVTGGAGYVGSHTCKALAKQHATTTRVNLTLCAHRSIGLWRARC